MKQTKPPCHGQPVFTNPQPIDPATFDAIEMCTHCPIRQQCALDALTAGDTLDKVHRSPANGVIQAGVWCNGDQDTANQLAAIAGVTPPHTGAQKRFTPPETCKGCGKPMQARIKGQPLENQPLTHAAHGYCRICDARRRRQKDWQSTQPKNTTIFTWKEKRHARTRSNGPGRSHPAGTSPRNRPSHHREQAAPGRKAQQSLF